MDGGVSGGPWFSEINEGSMVIEVEKGCREQRCIVEF